MSKCLWLLLLSIAPLYAQELSGQRSLRLPNYNISAQIVHEGSFQFQRSGTSLTNWIAVTNFNALPGTNSFTDSITNQQRFYRLMRFTEPAAITNQPVGLTNFYNEEVRLEAAAIGSWPMRFWWTKDGAIVPGATSNVLVFAGRVNLSGTYKLTASNSWGVATSSAAVVKTVNPVATSIMNKKIQYVIKGREGAAFAGSGSFETTYGSLAYTTTSSNASLNDQGQWQYGTLNETTGRALLSGGFVFPNGARMDMTFTNLTEGTYNLTVVNYNGRQFGEFKVAN
jgi:hypothetical protein